MNYEVDTEEGTNSETEAFKAEGGSQYGYDSCGAMDLSSNAGSSVKAVSDEESEEAGVERRKRILDESEEEIRRKRRRLEEEKMEVRARNKRRNIKAVLERGQLDRVTQSAKAAEESRLARLGGGGPSSSDHTDSDTAADVREEEEEEEETTEGEDLNNSGMHVDDSKNLRDSEGRVLVNLGHPGADPDIFTAPQLAAAIKPHQIGGVRFLYDNIIESVEQFEDSEGFGCILAHNMGLGKTMQMVTFTDIFLTHTPSSHVLCIVPINTIQNWLAEFNYWLPARGETSRIAELGCKVYKPTS